MYVCMYVGWFSHFWMCIIKGDDDDNDNDQDDDGNNGDDNKNDNNNGTINDNDSDSEGENKYAKQDSQGMSNLRRCVLITDVFF